MEVFVDSHEYGELQFQCRDPQTGKFFFKNRKTGKTYNLVK